MEHHQWLMIMTTLECSSGKKERLKCHALFGTGHTPCLLEIMEEKYLQRERKIKYV